MGYIDPNIFGIVSQVGFIVFFGITTTFVFFSKTLRSTFSRTVRILLRRPAAPLSEEKKG